MKKYFTYLTIWILAFIGMQTMQAKNRFALPTKAEVQQMLMDSRWYIAKGEGPGGPLLVGGTYEYSATHRTVKHGLASSSMKYKIISVRPSQSGMSYFFDVKINSTDSGTSWVEECMLKPSGSMIIRREGFSWGGKEKVMFLEIVPL
jgi:hypothetical protein